MKQMWNQRLELVLNPRKLNSRTTKLAITIFLERLYSEWNIYLLCLSERLYKYLLVMFEWKIIQRVKETTHTHNLCLNESIFSNLVAKSHKTLLYAQIVAMIREFCNVVNRKYGLRGSLSNSRAAWREYFIWMLCFLEKLVPKEHKECSQWKLEAPTFEFLHQNDTCWLVVFLTRHFAG